MQKICTARHAKFFEPENKILPTSITAVGLLILLLVATLVLPATRLWNSASSFAMPGKISSYEPLPGNLPLSPERGLHEDTHLLDSQLEETGLV